MIHERKQPQPITLEMVMSMAQETILRDGEHVPTLIVDGSLHPTVMQLFEFGNSHEERVQQLVSIGYHLAKENRAGELQQVFLITEAWMSTISQGSIPSQSPSQDPNRKEVLLISQFNVRKLEGKLVLYEMRRTPDGHLLELVAFPVGEGEINQSDNRLLTAFTLGFQMGEMERR